MKQVVYRFFNKNGFGGNLLYIEVCNGKSIFVYKRGRTEPADDHGWTLAACMRVVRQGYWTVKKGCIKTSQNIYNTMIDVAFTVEGPWKKFKDIPYQAKIDAMQKRLDYLRENPEDGAEAFGFCDSYKVKKK